MKSLRIQNFAYLGLERNVATDRDQNYLRNLGSGGGQQRVIQPLVETLETQLYEQGQNFSQCI